MTWLSMVRVSRVGASRMILAVAAVLAFGVLAVPAGAGVQRLEAATPTALAVAVSQAMVPDGAAEAVLLAPADDVVLAATATSFLGAMPRQSALLLSGTDTLDDTTLTELGRLTGRAGTHEGAVVHLAGPFAAGVATALEARGYTVIAHPLTDPTALAESLAVALYGAPGGTSQRVALTAPDDALSLALAGVYGVQVGLTAVPVPAAGVDLDTFLRKVVLVADPAVVPDEVATSQQGAPASVRTWDADPVARSGLVAALAKAEPGDGDVSPVPLAFSPVVIEAGEDPYAAVIAATVTQRRALDGHLAPLLITSVAAEDATCAGDEGHPDCLVASADGDVTVLALTAAPEPTPAPGPLPSTGGGRVALAVVVLALGGGLAAFVRRG